MMKRHNNLTKKRNSHNFMQVFTCCLTFLLTVHCLCLNNGVFYAAENTKKSFTIGEGITAVLEDGTLTITGQGAVNDFDATSAPFKEYANDIRGLVIEEGITYIGSYLFYGMSNLTGSLVLPKSLTGFGDYAFSGETLDNAPKFTDIQNMYDETTEQSIPHIETLFYPGQTGMVSCSEKNAAFVSAASLAGYKISSTTSEIPKENEDLSDAQSNAEKENKPQQGETSAPVTNRIAKAIPRETNPNHEVYVDSDEGDDNTGSGTKGSPVKTIEKAAELLDSSGTAETNRIVLLSNYKLNKGAYTSPVYPFTICGENPDITLFGGTDTIDNNGFTLSNNIIFDNLKLDKIGHIYACGHDVTLTETVTGSNLYLYGSDNGAFTGVGTLTVNGGTFSRIVGYIRSSTSIEANNKLCTINIGGKANVALLIAGTASGSVQNGNVAMNINGGSVGTIGGGCQGFQTNPSAYSGETAIIVNGGSIGNIYGAGTGRDQSAPTFKGKLNIEIKGGNVKNVYGAGSAGYIVSDSDSSKVYIKASGGEIGNIYAAGKGVETSVKPKSDSPLENTEQFGSLSGDAVVEVSGTATITGNVYASGQGGKTDNYDSTQNAYVKGKVAINVTGGTILGNVFAGGEGVIDNGYETCARVEKDSVISVNVSGGIIEGDIYGGGKTAKVIGKTIIDINGGTVKKNVYGGGKQGLVEQRTTVYIRKGTINGSVYGGAQGVKDTYSAHGGSTLNMTGGWVRGNLYGGSELSNDGKETSETQDLPDLVFVNLTGGTVDGKVFGGSYKGIVNGSTHLHIGLEAVGKCKYYAGAGQAEKPTDLTISNLKIGGSIYAGGDYGGDGVGNYDAITVKGYSHVYIDGTGYSFQNGSNSMKISEGVFGSGASCDAGDKRLVTLDNVGIQKTDASGEIIDATSLKSIQRADQVRIIKSHIRLSGQSDVANANQTTLYSLNRIGDKGSKEGLGQLDNALVLEGGSTIVLDSASIDLANIKSVDDSEQPVTLEKIKTIPNEIVLTTGTMLRIAYTNTEGTEVYGGVHGYSRISITDAKAKAYAYARNLVENSEDGGFVSHSKPDSPLAYQSVGKTYRYWEITNNLYEDVESERDTVLTAQTKAGAGEFVTEKAVVELPPILKESTFRIDKISLPSSVTLTNAAINEENAWQCRDDGTNDDIAKSQESIKKDPLHTFGLYMRMGEGFQASEKGSVIPSNDPVGTHTTKKVVGALDKLPEVEFYLTYDNQGITKSQDLGEVIIEAIRFENDVKKEKITLRVSILTKATSLSDQTLDLYATQTGSYTGKLIVPSGTSRTLTLTGISNNTSLKKVGELNTATDMAITMLPVNNQGWNSADRMTEPFDLATKSEESVILGTTDSRYEAPIEFTLYNLNDFSAKDSTDKIVLTITDSSSNNVKITLQIHWKNSIVECLENCAGKKYEDFSYTDPVTISSESALTTAFQLGTVSDNMDKIWLELRNKEDVVVPMPMKTKITLMVTGKKFYTYKVTGSEADNKVPMTMFKEMWGEGSPQLQSNQKITCILDFDSTTGLDAGEYSFRLRSESTADSIGSAFTIGPSSASIILDGEPMSASNYKFTLSVSNDIDTHLLEQAAVVISPEDTEDFPEGTTFEYKNKVYPLVQGKAYLVMDEFKKQEIIMNIQGSDHGSFDDKRIIKLDVYPIGINAGTSIYNTSGAYALDKKAKFAIDVSLPNRKVKAGDTLQFIAEYAMENFKGESMNIDVAVLKKTNTSYVPVDIPWNISGNNGIKGNGTQIIHVIVPADTEAGTYRVVFTLGDKTMPYNIIVSDTFDRS